jgi:hypothetical protein
MTRIPGRLVIKDKPVVPDDTCPYIDMAQELIDKICETEDVTWRRDQATLAKALLEHVRESNVRLRHSSKFWYGKYRP